MKNRKAVTFTELLIALSIGMVILMPTSIMFSNSAKLMEKSSNLSFAAGLARYILQGMMTMDLKEITDIKNPISCCDTSEDNKYLKFLFNLNDNCGEFKKGKVLMGKNSCPKLYARLAKFDYRYSVLSVPLILSQKKQEIMSSVKVCIHWKEFGVDKIYESHAYIIQR